MADIFLSYSRADRPKAQVIAEALEAEGFSVWWDKVLRAGQTYDEVTEGMLRDSQVVIVLWSEVSVKSKWVRAEATLGQRTSAVIPAMIEDAERPIMFELTQSADLIGWEGDRTDPRWQQFVADIRLALTRAPAETVAPAAAAAEKSAPVDATIETTFWTSVSDTTDPADLHAYLKRYPDGHYSALARNRLAQLERKAAPAPAPVPQTQTKPAPAPVPAKGGFPTGAVIAGLAIMGIVAVVALGVWSDRDPVPAIPDEAPEPVTVFADCDTCPAMQIIEAGSFMMGSPEDEDGRTGNESPRHDVTLPRFAIGKTEITFDEWDACLADGGCGGYEPPDRGFGRGGQPVIGVSWQDAQSYARWLSGKTDRTYRLPTEAEWEYAARGGTETPYWWGTAFSSQYAPTGAPRPVSELAENPFGLQGMLGNAREWVEDCYINNYNDAPTDGTAQRGGDCSLRVLRGGAWPRDADDHRAANRARIDAGVRDQVFGFRVASSDVRPPVPPAP